MPYTNEARSAEFLGLWPQTKRKCLGFGAMLLNPPNTIYTLHILIYLMLTNVLSFLRGLRFYLIYPPKGVCESRSPEGVHFSKLIQERNLALQFKGLTSNFFSKMFYLVDGWVGCDILSPSIFFIFGYVNSHNVLVTNMLSNLSTAFRSKVMIDLCSKFGKIKADIIVVNWSEKLVDKNTLLWWRFFSHIINMIFHSKTWKIPNLQKCYQNGSKPIS